MIRLVLALWLAVSGTFTAMPRLPDANLAMAMAVGALCAAEPGTPAQDETHAHCQACLAAAGTAMPVPCPQLPSPAHLAAAAAGTRGTQPVPNKSRPAYASRAPPAMVA